MQRLQATVDHNAVIKAGAMGAVARRAFADTHFQGRELPDEITVCTRIEVDSADILDHSVNVYPVGLKDGPVSLAELQAMLSDARRCREYYGPETVVSQPDVSYLPLANPWDAFAERLLRRTPWEDGHTVIQYICMTLMSEIAACPDDPVLLARRVSARLSRFEEIPEVYEIDHRKYVLYTEAEADAVEDFLGDGDRRRGWASLAEGFEEFKRSMDAQTREWQSLNDQLREIGAAANLL